MCARSARIIYDLLTSESARVEQVHTHKQSYCFINTQPSPSISMYMYVESYLHDMAFVTGNLLCWLAQKQRRRRRWRLNVAVHLWLEHAFRLKGIHTTFWRSQKIYQSADHSIAHHNASLGVRYFHSFGQETRAHYQRTVWQRFLISRN